MTFSLIYLHIICAFTSLALLIVRGLMQLFGKNWRAIKLLKILPHLSDTLLIISGAIILFTMSFGFPWWIIGKLVLLICYVIWATSYFHKTATPPNVSKLLLACAAFVGAMLLGYFH
ncbi:SirB2 family protein [Necropsobacter massiliensis]|uniref:SirB2 family protein n=1 Tax=Necropsobacter massiliensis TaxID=1400001 RepID=UPI000595DE7C|nr:SirB2 family protein [Necropsobacter massiliensis]